MTKLADINTRNPALLELNPGLHELVGEKPAKYQNVQAIFEGETYQSGREAKRAADLALMYRAGEITCLERQVVFHLPGKTKYIADFVYIQIKNPLTVVVEDAKGVQTEPYRIKKRLMWETYNIKITEV